MKIYKVYIERENQAELTGCEQEVKFFSDIELAKEYFNILRESDSFVLFGEYHAVSSENTYFECKVCGLSSPNHFKIYKTLWLREIEVESEL